MDDHTVFNLPDIPRSALLKADNALEHNDIDGAKKDIGRRCFESGKPVCEQWKRHVDSGGQSAFTASNTGGVDQRIAIGFLVVHGGK